MDNILIFGLLVYSFSCAGFCATVAKAKKQNDTKWFILGLLFNVLALLAIVGMPDKPE